MVIGNKIERIILVVSDFHLGKGPYNEDGSLNFLEDFFYDDKFEEFLDYYDRKYSSAEIELVLNGDIFDLLQVDYREEYPARITEENALYRFNKIVEGHPVFFDALRKFLSKPNRKLVYIQGNHDAGFLFPRVRDRLEEVIGVPYHYAGMMYKTGGYWIEHGQQYEPSNRYKEDELFITRGVPEPIVNLPWGSVYVISILNKLRMKRPYVDKVRPFSLYFRWGLINDFFWGVMALLRSFLFFLSKQFIKTRWYRTSLKETFEIIMEKSFAHPLEKSAEKILKTTDYHTVIFSHTHKMMIKTFKEGKKYINTGCWIEMIDLDLVHFGKNLRFTYAEIDFYKNGDSEAFLREWRGPCKEVEEVYQHY